MTADPRKFAEEIEDIAKEIEKEATYYVRSEVSKIFKTVTMYSPVYTGSFMRSHRLSFNRPDRSFTLIKVKKDSNGNYIRAPRGPAVAAALERLWMLETWNLERGADVIHISNSVPHAFSVEFGDILHNVPAYAPYARAKADYLAGSI